MRYFLEIAYRGTNYNGWQVQNNSATVQGIIELWLSRILNCTVAIVGSSRTDSGVHANQQYAHFDFIEEIDRQKLLYSMNSVLPKDISIKSLFKVDDSFHARYSAVSRTYEYTILTHKDPFLSDTSYFFMKKLDIELMNEVVALLCERDLNCKAFSKTSDSISNYLCSISAARWINTNQGCIFQITSNRFLRGMVRIIVAYCLEVGLYKLTIDEFKKIIKEKASLKRPSLAPAPGLTLVRVRYL